MARLFVTGMTGGIGPHFARALEADHDIIPIGRRTSHPDLPATDLVQRVPEYHPSPLMCAAGGHDGHAVATSDPEHQISSVSASSVAQAMATTTASDREQRWILHLATTYNVTDDLAMLDHLIEFAQENEIDHFLYFSSWVVHFPRRLFSAEYIRMKRLCEERLRNSGIKGVHIVRPSVILGRGLSWSRILERLAPIEAWIPRSLTRSFVDVKEVCEQVRKILAGENRSRFVTILGDRHPLAEMASRSSKGSMRWTRWLTPRMVRSVLVAALIGCVIASVWNPDQAWLALLMIGLLLLTFVPALVSTIAGFTSDYFAGFHVRSFVPETRDEITALFQACNPDVQVRGYNNQSLYFQNPTSPNSNAITLRRFNRVIEIDSKRNLVRVESGVHFGDLLRTLDAHGKWLANYPNYHFISVGACIATPVHGSNLQLPFLADLIESVTVYDRSIDAARCLRRGEWEFQKLFFDPLTMRDRIVLEAELQMTDRQRYSLESRKVPIEALSFDQGEALQAETQHREIRINLPRSRYASVQTYRQVSEADAANDPEYPKLLPIKADAIGRQWNLMQRNSLTSWCTSALSSQCLNFEWFFQPETFPDFWRALHEGQHRPGFYKLLVRYNRVTEHLATPFHGTISIDITVLNRRASLKRSVELFERFRPLEHLGKYSIERYLRRTKHDSTIS